MASNKIYLLLGGNEGARLQWLAAGRKAITDNIGNIINASGIYETAAWGNEEQAAFLNQVVVVNTVLAAGDVLLKIKNIELDVAGRVRAKKWAPRTLDIDILFYNDEVIEEPGLTIPHPHLRQRRFVLVPLCEVAADFIHPVLGSSIASLLAACADPLPVMLIVA